MATPHYHPQLHPHNGGREIRRVGWYRSADAVGGTPEWRFWPPFAASMPWLLRRP
jgi:hypothetical protein